jgi:hypothetical protein
MVTKLKDKVSKEGFLQNVELEGFRDQARDFIGDHPRQVPTSPSNLSLKKTSFKSVPNRKIRVHEKKPIWRREREKGRRNSSLKLQPSQSHQRHERKLISIPNPRGTHLYKHASVQVFIST